MAFNNRSFHPGSRDDRSSKIRRIDTSGLNLKPDLSPLANTVSFRDGVSVVTAQRYLYKHATDLCDENTCVISHDSVRLSHVASDFFIPRFKRSIRCSFLIRTLNESQSLKTLERLP